MPRLSDQDIIHLVDSLEVQQHRESTAELDRGAAAQEAPGSRGELASLQARLRSMVGDGHLGPIVTQRLAAYVGKPIGCSCDERAHREIDGPIYTAHSHNVNMLLKMEPLLVSALADAMIGGEGEAAKVGFGSKVAKLGSKAALEILRSVAQALQLPEPALVDEADTSSFVADASGIVTIATQEYGWKLGLTMAKAAEAKPLAQPPAAGSSATLQTLSGRPRTGVETALDQARRRLETALGTAVRFDAATVTASAGAQMPPGWLRLSLALRGGGAIVLAIEKQTAVAAVNCCLGAEVVSDGPAGALLDSGAEAIFRTALYALAETLGSTPDELHHIVRLSDDAILADLPYVSVEHDAAWGNHREIMRWLVPAHGVPLERPAAVRPKGGD